MIGRTVVLFLIATLSLTCEAQKNNGRAVLSPSSVGVALTPQTSQQVVAWNYNYITNPPCTSTVINDCVSGFEQGDFDANGVPQVSQSVPNPSGGIGTNVLVTAPFTRPTSYGQKTCWVRTVARGPAGQRVESRLAAFECGRLPDSPINPRLP